MAAEEESPTTLSREDLYELVWSKPMSELAKDFGISDVALAKRCRRLGIPVLGRGYWARVDAGQKPYRPKLPKREPQWFDQGALTVAPLDEEASSDSTQGSEGALAQAQNDEAWLKERLAFEAQPEHLIIVPASTRKWDRVIASIRDDIEQAAEKLRKSKQASDRYDKWPEARKRLHIDSDSWPWRWGRDRGQRIWDTHRAVALRVSLDCYKRALSIINALALAAPERGFGVLEDKDAGRVVFDGHKARIQLRLAEILEDATRPEVRYDGKIEQVKYKVPTGRLRITLQVGYNDGHSFEDRKDHSLDGQLNSIFSSICRLVLKAWRQERKHQEIQRRIKEEEQQRAERERIRKEAERVKAEDRARRHNLSLEATRWIRTQRIRDYVAHILAEASKHPTLDHKLEEWSRWALQVASDTDPTPTRLDRA